MVKENTFLEYSGQLWQVCYLGPSIGLWETPWQDDRNSSGVQDTSRDGTQTIFKFIASSAQLPYGSLGLLIGVLLLKPKSCKLNESGRFKPRVNDIQLNCLT